MSLFVLISLDIVESALHHARSMFTIQMSKDVAQYTLIELGTSKSTFSNGDESGSKFTIQMFGT